jgi:glycosyltransferase involved in cell wall biosynthesis
MARRLRVAYAMINCNRRDGTARAVNEVAERMSQRHEIHLFARRAEDIDLSRLKWHFVPGIRRPAILDFLTYHGLVRFQLRPQDFDIIHSIGNNAATANVITIQNIQPAKRLYLDSQAKSTNISTVRKFSRQLYLNTTTKIEGRMYNQREGKKPVLFLPVSRGVEQDLRRYYDIGNASVRVVPNAAETDKFKPLENSVRQRWRNENGVSGSDIVLVFVGGEWPRKGLEFAIRALVCLPDERVKLLVLGKDPEQKRFSQLAQQCGVSSRVRFFGFRNDVATALASSDIFVFPSWYEAFSLATIEAAACGLPIVATRINGAEDFITPGETGFFIEHDPEQIAATLMPLVANEAERRRMGENARELVERCYTWDRVADLTEQAYLEFLSQHNVPVATAGASAN